ncbi:MAG: thiamine phosphate synthase [Planctomycetota bacterium]
MEHKRSAGKALEDLRLYALVTESQCHHHWRSVVEELLAGGVDAIQLREKNCNDRELLRRARIVRELTQESDALFVVNDRPDVAVLSSADGVHVGQKDLPAEEVRSLVGDGMVVGLSTHDEQQLREACEAGVDYAGVGPVHATATRGYDKGGGTGLVNRLAAMASMPTVAIGGITPDEVGELFEAGVQAIAVCSALCAARSPRKAAETFRTQIEKATRK